MEKGLGFISMKERLHVLGGEMNVYSKPLRGTRIEVSVPFATKQESLPEFLTRTGNDFRFKELEEIYETPPRHTRR
jgi:hypothetical protein